MSELQRYEELIEKKIRYKYYIRYIIIYRYIIIIIIIILYIYKFKMFLMQSIL